MAKEKALLPLTDGEKEELGDLERRAKEGRQDLQPSAAEMLRLGKLRERAIIKATAKEIGE